MNDTDAMVLSLIFDGPRKAAAVPVRARAERQKAGARKGIVRRVATAMFKRRARLLSPITASSRRIVAAASRGEMGAGTARAVASPWGLIAAGVIVAGVVALRLASDQPLEGTGEYLNKMILGDMDEESRAKTAVRKHFTDDSELTRIAAKAGGVTAQMSQLQRDLFKLARNREVGATMFRSQYPVDNLIDMLILRVVAGIKAAWNGDGVAASMERLKTNYAKSVGTAIGVRAGGLR